MSDELKEKKLDFIQPGEISIKIFMCVCTGDERISMYEKIYRKPKTQRNQTWSSGPDKKSCIK